MFKKLLITCDEGTTICDKSQYKEASFYELVQLNLHIFMCKICSLYSRQNRKMSKFYKMNSLECKKKQNCLSETDKNALKKQIEEFKI